MCFVINGKNSPNKLTNNKNQCKHFFIMRNSSVLFKNCVKISCANVNWTDRIIFWYLITITKLITFYKIVIFKLNHGLYAVLMETTYY